MKDRCLAQIATLMALVALAAPSARGTQHIWAEESAPKVRRELVVSTGRADRLGIQPREGPVTSVMVALLTWIAGASNYAVPDRLPDVVAMATADFELYLCEQVEQCSVVMPPVDTLAFFDFQSRTIYVPQQFDPHDVGHRSTMVRELVHFLQALAGRGRGCRGVLAPEARQIANRWRADHGLPPAPLTPLEILFQSCVPGWT
jgi:hypothetical protein